MINFEGVGDPVSLVVKKNDKPTKKGTIASVSFDDEVNEPFPAVELDIKHRFQLIPNTKKERNVIYITGASGSGKSYFTKQYCGYYKKFYPDNPIYVFSSITDDETLDKASNLFKRVKLDEEFLKEDFDIKDFKDSLIIFDDTDVIRSKPLKMKVRQILEMILQTGRHTNTSVIYTSHLANNGNETKIILAECHSLTIFPTTLQSRSFRYLLEQYFGCDKDQQRKIKELGKKSRAVSIIKTNPMIVMSDNYIGVLNEI